MSIKIITELSSKAHLIPHKFETNRIKRIVLYFYDLCFQFSQKVKRFLESMFPCKLPLHFHNHIFLCLSLNLSERLPFGYFLTFYWRQIFFFVAFMVAGKRPLKPSIVFGTFKAFLNSLYPTGFEAVTLTHALNKSSIFDRLSSR